MTVSMHEHPHRRKAHVATRALVAAVALTLGVWAGTARAQESTIQPAQPGGAAPAPAPAAQPAPAPAEAPPPAAAPPPATVQVSPAPPPPGATLEPPKPKKSIGGHIGFVFPFVTAQSAGLGVSHIGENFSIGVSSGLGWTIYGPLRFDAELVAFADQHRRFTLVVHPGLILGLPAGFAVGFRGGWNIQSGAADAIGFTPLVNKGFSLGSSGLAWYVELDFPVRFVNGAPVGSPVDANVTAFTFAFHTGFGF